MISFDQKSAPRSAKAAAAPTSVPAGERPRRLARAAATLAALTALLALAGWLFDEPVLQSLAGDKEAMNPVTALALLCAAGAMALQTRPGRGRRVASALALATALVGLAKLVAVLGGPDVEVDQVPFRSPLLEARGATNEMAPNSALCLLLLGLSLWLQARGRRIALAQWLALSAGYVAFFAVLGYLYGFGGLYRVPTHIPMAVNTAVAGSLLALGALALRPREGPVAVVAQPGAGGYLARRLLPAVIVVPIIFGAVRLWGDKAGIATLESGVVFTVVVAILLASALVWETARAVGRAERARSGMKEDLRESTLFLESIVENIPLMVFVKDARELRFVKYNRAGEEIVGISRFELIGKSDHDFFPAEQADFFNAKDREVLASAEVVDIPEEPIETVAGETRILHTRKVPLLGPDGEPHYLLGISEDITDRREAEEARRHLAAIVDSTNDAIISKSLEGTILTWNAGAQKLYGYTAAQAVGRHISMLVPKGQEDEIADVLARIRAGEAIQQLETERVARDGRRIAVSLTISPIHDQAGNVVAASTIARDVTAEKRAEREIRELNRELEAFSYSVSHDLRAPLRAAVGFSQALLEDYADKLDDQGRQLLERVVAAGRRMGSLIDDLLAFSRLSRAELRRQPVDLSGMARDVASTLQDAEPARSVQLDVADGMTAVGDPTLLRAVLENLLGNAWKFTRKRDEAKIQVGEVRLHQNGGPTYFVRDNGAGFSMEYADKLFAPFQRLHSADEFEGTGIGLANVQRIVSRHGGRVWAEGVSGVGATFYFTLGGE